MRSIALVGGKLQGFEVTYLAKKAGIKVVLVDRNKYPLIKTMVDDFHCFDVIEKPEKLIDISRTVNGIIPVNENLDTIEFLKTIKDKLACPLLFDFDAYHISSDKKRSKKYFNSINIPTPIDKPTVPPYFVKPPCQSSSVGTSVIFDDEGLEDLDPSMLIEEYVEGDVISLEVVGDGKNFAVIKETKVYVEETYDCHMVKPIGHYSAFRDISYKLAKNMNLRGIMDIEAIDNPGGLKVIEIDARFPSQTPTVVYHCTGINLVELLFQAFSDGVQELDWVPDNNYCIFEHLTLKDGKLVPIGENVISQGIDYHEFYISEELEIFECKGETNVFTLISWGSVKAELEGNRQKGLGIVNEYLGINKQGA